MPNLNLKVLVDVIGAEKLRGVSGSLQRAGFNLTKFVTLPLVGAGAAAFAFASDADESMNKAKTVFGDAFSEIATDAENMNDAFSEAQFLDTAGTFGAIAQGMGATQEASAKLSEAWLGAAQDLASFNNVPIEESLTAIRAALSGEFEPLKRFGILLNVAKVEAKALEMGLISEGEELTDNARLMATNALVMEGLGVAAGDFGRTSEGAANSLKTLAGNSADLAAELGTQLLPVGLTVLTWAKNAFTWFSSLPQPVKDLIVPIAGVVAAIGPLVFIGGKLVGSFKAIGAAFTAMKVLLLANPFVALAAAVLAITALIILNWDKIVSFLTGIWNKIVAGVADLANRLRTVWGWITEAVTTAWNGIVGIIKGSINAVIGLINGFIGFLNGIQFNISIPNPFGDDINFGFAGLNLPTIPYLAEGGIITKPTLAILGESGPEAVIPLDENTGRGDFHSHITVLGQPPFIQSEDDLVRVQQRIAFLEGF